VKFLDLFEAIKNRRSIRKYRQQNIEKDKIRKILEIARLSPSAMNRQPYGFIVVSENSTIKEISSACNQKWDAPVIIVVFGLPDQAWVRDDGEEYWKADAAIAMSNMSLAAYALGLGTCWVAAFKDDELNKILHIPSNAVFFAMTPLGYPDEKKGPVKKRKPLEDLVHYDRW